MDTPQGAVAPYQDNAIMGQIMPPAASPDSHNLHRAIQLFHEIADHSTAFKTEGEKLEAHNILDALRSVWIPREDLHRVVKESDRAPVEDVRLRRSTVSSTPIPAAAPIDYNALAEAIVAVQTRNSMASSAQQVQPVPQPEQVHVITDVPPQSAIDGA